MFTFQRPSRYPFRNILYRVIDVTPIRTLVIPESVNVIRDKLFFVFLEHIIILFTRITRSTKIVSPPFRSTNYGLNEPIIRLMLIPC